MNRPAESFPDDQDFHRWTCNRHDPPVLLGMVDDDGHLHIKVRNRDWFVTDFTRVTATCPKCGAVHTREFVAN